MPFLGQHTNDTLQTGNVITIEPGLYFPDWVGVRIEDVVVVEDDGYTNLTRAPRWLGAVAHVAQGSSHRRQYPTHGDGWRQVPIRSVGTAACPVPLSGWHALSLHGYRDLRPNSP